MKSTIDRIVEAINSDIDTQPTIRPVLDMSDVQYGMNKFNASLSKTHAASISFNMNRAAAEKFATGEPSVENGRVVNNNFVQNNYSPKALTPIEIYRQTKNQFAAAKEVLSK
jgi:hypothetical protein